MNIDAHGTNNESVTIFKYLSNRSSGVAEVSTLQIQNEQKCWKIIHIPNLFCFIFDISYIHFFYSVREYTVTKKKKSTLKKTITTK
jgi:hypothetical protein